ncbi:MAG: ankyrin repeat domain-containing protein [Microscillaceae bacterium]|nr:ankyrin repeat domain-containing protein [Microscillaceae bacterium]
MLLNFQIQQAIQTGNLDDLEIALPQQPAWATAHTEQGVSAVLLAMYYRQAAILRFLLAQNPPLNWYEACAVGAIEQAQAILLTQPDLLNAYAPDGFYALGLAVYFGQQNLAKWLIEQGANINQSANNSSQVAPIHAAVSTNNLAMLEYLLINGANVNQTQQQAVSPLHGAAHNGNLLIVKLLIKYGADTQAQMSDGKTPLDMAREAQKTEVVEFLSQIMSL